MTFRSCVLGSVLLIHAFSPGLLRADPLSKNLSIDFYRDVPSRNLKGLASRSDGRLVAGPTCIDLSGPTLADLLWCLEKSTDNKWLVGTGPDGKIYEVTLDLAKSSFTSREVAHLEEPQIFALKRLQDGALLVGTSPHGVLALVRGGQVVASVTLPVDSLFDFAALDDHTFLVATGNPGRIYRLDITKFAGSGLLADRLTDEKRLAEKGLSLFAEIRDRNVRRLAVTADRVFAGSSPKGNVYILSRAGGPPSILQENRETEVAALLPDADGGLYAALVVTTTQGESRINRPVTAKTSAEAVSTDATATSTAPVERFAGRSQVVYFPKDGFPETLVSRSNLAFYALARRGNTLLIGGGEQGDLLGYDVASRWSLSFPGSSSAQLSQVTPVSASQYLLLRNNAPGLALLDFSASSPREAETRRLDLGLPAKLGALHFDRIRDFDASALSVELRTSLSTDEVEGWSSPSALTMRDGEWFSPNLRGRYVKLHLKLPAEADKAQVDKASLYYLAQNRRPQLTDFRLVSPNYGLIPPPEPTTSPITTLTQLTGTDKDRTPDDKRKAAMMSSTVVPQPGTQIAFWTVTDLDGDNLAYTFSIRAENTETWTDLALSIKDSYVQFDISHLADGVYFTRLTAKEQAPRAAEDRLAVTFETDDLVIDKTPPAIEALNVSRDATFLTVTLSGRDALSLLEGAEFIFNNGYKEQVTQPADGIRDSKAETFVLRVPLEKVAGATSVEVILYDAPGNSAAKRIGL